MQLLQGAAPVDLITHAPSPSSHTPTLSRFPRCRWDSGAVLHVRVWDSTTYCVPICQPFTWLLWDRSDSSGSARAAGRQERGTSCVQVDTGTISTGWPFYLWKQASGFHQNGSNWQLAEWNNMENYIYIFCVEQDNFSTTKTHQSGQIHTEDKLFSSSTLRQKHSLK